MTDVDIAALGELTFLTRLEIRYWRRDRTPDFKVLDQILPNCDVVMRPLE
jgi:hypothetical protein